jgi:drug/metabolite transporter (DMT)-like permease
VRPAERSAPSAAAAYAALTVTSLLWSGNTITGRALHEAIPPAAFAFWRWVLILLLLAPFVAGELVRLWPVIRRSWRILAALGLMSTALYHALIFWALHHTAAINAQLLNSTIPLWVLLMAWLALGARPTRREGLGLAVSGVGVAAILARGEWQRLAALEFNAGDLLMLAGMIVWSVYTLCLPRRPRALSAFAYTFVAGAFGLAGIAPIYAWELATGRGEFALTGAVVAGILYTALLASIVATATFNFGVDRAGAARASFFTHLVPVFGAVLGVALLGEPVGWYHLAGFALILAGIAIATRVPWRLGSARGAG